MKIEVNRHAPAYHKEEITINAPAAEAYKILAEIDLWPEWLMNVSHTEIEGEVKEGMTFRWKAKGVNIVSKLHTAKPYTQFGWTGKIWWITAVHNWTFTEQNGKTKVMAEESMEGFLAGLAQGTLVKDMKQSLMDLKEVVENG